jgi:nitrate ABC transporter ATP-binding subunit
MPSYVELFNLKKTYETPKGPQVVVEGFTLNLEQNEVVALLGHSGCGKSTVLSMVAGLNDITDGGIILDNREISGPGPDRGVVFQSPCLMPWLTAFENVALGVDRVFPHGTRQQRHDIVTYYLSLVGLADTIGRKASDLSIGMQQRVGIARAFAIAPKMLLLDEPFGMLDSLTRMDLQDVLLALLERDAKTALMVTHDVDEALFVADRIVMMTNGPRAKVGDVIVVPWERPRVRADVLNHPQYYELRGRMIRFLEDQDERRASHPPMSNGDDGDEEGEPDPRENCADVIAEVA